MTVDQFASSLMLTSELPARLTFSTAYAAVKVKVSYAAELVFSTTLYPYGGRGELTGLRDIVEDYMREDGSSWAEVTVLLDDGSATASTTATVIYCTHRIGGSAAEFVTQHFLTLKDALLVPRGSDQLIPYFLPEEENSTPTLRCIVGDNTVLILLDEDGEDAGTTINTDNVSYDTILAKLAESFPGASLDILRAVTIERAARSISVYYTNQEPALHLKFRNAFNVLIDAYLFGTLTTKTDMDRTEATCLGITQFYNESLNQTFEFESSALSYDDAIYLNQLLTSPYIMLVPPNVGLPSPQILITDITSEITDNSAETSRIKFTFKYSSITQLHDVPAASKGIFTEPFTKPFL